MSRSPQRPDDKVTELLAALRQAGPDRADGVLDELVTAAYGNMRRIAAAELRRNRRVTLQATELAHEAVLRFAGFESVAWAGSRHFYAIISRLMRRVIVDRIRADRAEIRNGGIRPIPLAELAGEPAAQESRAERALHHEDLERLDVALDELRRLDPEQAQLVEMKYFGNYTIDQLASALESSPATVKRRWCVAKGWLLTRIRQEAGDDPEQDAFAG